MAWTCPIESVSRVSMTIMLIPRQHFDLWPIGMVGCSPKFRAPRGRGPTTIIVLHLCLDLSSAHPRRRSAFLREGSVLERDLIRLDDDDYEKRGLALSSRQHDEETDKDPLYSRKVLIQKIDEKLKEYGEQQCFLKFGDLPRVINCLSR